MDGDGGLARAAVNFSDQIDRSGVRSAGEKRSMETIGFVGVGKIGMPISENLIKSGYRVVGYRRSSLAEFEKIGGVPARSSGRRRRAGRHRVLLPAVDRGARRRRCRARTGSCSQRGRARSWSSSARIRCRSSERQIAPLAAKGAAFVDGEVSGTPGMVAARKGVIYLAGDADACKKAERVVAGFADSCLYFGEFGAASRVKLVNNLLVAINIAATAEAMALGLKAGVDVPTDDQGDRHRQRRLDPVRHPRALDGASGASLPAQGTVPALAHYFDMIGDFADSVGVATPMLDRAAELYDAFMAMGLGEQDVAAMVDVIGSLPRAKT